MMIRRMMSLLIAMVFAIGMDAQDVQSSGLELHESHFSWGADLGSSIDVSGNDMSSISLDAYFGYKNDILRIVGVGAGINAMLSNGSRLFPIYAMLRTNFQSTPSLAFLDLKAGTAVGYLESDETQTGFYGSIGVGFNLAVSKKFRSHVIVGYSYTGLQSYSVGEKYIEQDDLHTMSVRIGISF